MQPANDTVFALFTELKHDIELLKREQRMSALPPQEQQLYGVLADLRHEIEALKREQTTHHLPPHEQQLYGVLAELRRDIASLKHEQSHQAIPSGEQHLYGMLAELRRDIERLRHDEGAPAIPPHERELYGMLADLRREIHDIHELKAHSYRPSESREAIAAAYGARAAEHQPRSASPGLAAWWSNDGLLRNIVVSYVPVALIAIAAVYALTKPQPHAIEPGMVIAAPSTVPTPARAMLKDDATPVYEALASGSMSPKGVPVAGVDSQQALARAQALLSVTGPARDTEEGGFWLKRYLALAQGDKQLPRALTQLGSVYAEPAANGTADCAGARRMWEIAGALGDPIAMCFLGRLFERGLSVQANKAMALQWYERAKDAGGCAGLDDSIARVR